MIKVPAIIVLIYLTLEMQLINRKPSVNPVLHNL